MKPSEFPRDPRFLTPGPAIVEDGIAHLRSYGDVRRANLDTTAEDFTLDTSYWAPQDQRIHLTWYFVWATGVKRADGSPGRHPELRQIAEPWFRKRAVTTMTPRIQQIADYLVRAIVERGTGEFDMAADFAYPLAYRTVCSLVGLPQEREHWMRDHLEAMAQAADVADQLRREPPEVEDYLRQTIQARIKAPGDELLDLLIAAWQEDRISEVELFAYMWGFFQAGAGTTAPHIANLFALLDEFKLLDQARDHTRDESWLQGASEEALRYTTPFPAGPLLTVREVVLEDGQRLPAWTQIRTWFSAANRDPRVNGDNTTANPTDVFDPTRSPNRHLGFGVGLRHCFGAPLARIESVIALRTLLDQLPDLGMDSSKPFERYAGVIDGVRSAPFRFDQARAERATAEGRVTSGRAT
jgi:cytochrome P450